MSSKQTWWGKLGLDDPVEFTHSAIVNLRSEGRKGINTVISGFNSAFNSYYKEAIKQGHIKPITVINANDEERTLIGVEAFTTKLREEGLIGMVSMAGRKTKNGHPVPGVMIYLPGDAPVGKDPKDVINKIRGK